MYESESINKILGTVIKELRTQQGLSQEQLEEAVGLQQKSLGQIETGRNFVTSKLLAKLCNYFNVAPSVMFTQKPQIMCDKHINYSKEIIKLLPSFSADKLQEIYNILLIMKK